MKILVAGIGNIFLGDDAFGSEVARRLLVRPWPATVRVVDFGIRGFDLTLALLEDYDAIVLVDAAPRGGAPGTLYTIEPDLSALDGAGATVEMHAMDPVRVLAVAKSIGAPLRRVFLIGCEPSPETVDPEGEGSMELSAPVRGAVEEAVHVVENLVENLKQETSGVHQSAGG